MKYLLIGFFLASGVAVGCSVDDSIEERGTPHDTDADLAKDLDASLDTHGLFPDADSQSTDSVDANSEFLIPDDVEGPFDVEVVRVDLDAMPPLTEPLASEECGTVEPLSQTWPSWPVAIHANQSGDVFVGNLDDYTHYYSRVDSAPFEFGDIIASESYDRVLALEKVEAGRATVFRGSGSGVIFDAEGSEFIELQHQLGMRHNVIAARLDPFAVYNAPSPLESDTTPVLQRCDREGICQELAPLPDIPHRFVPAFASESHVVWAGLEAIWRTDLRDGTTRAIVRETSPHGLWVDGARLAWVDDEADLFATRMGSSTILHLDSSLTSIVGTRGTPGHFLPLHLDGDLLYWSGEGGTIAFDVARQRRIETKLGDMELLWLISRPCAFIVAVPDEQDALSSVARVIPR